MRRHRYIIVSILILVCLSLTGVACGNGGEATQTSPFEQMQADITGLQARLTSLEARVASINPGTDNSAQISQLQSELAIVISELDNLVVRLDALEEDGGSASGSLSLDVIGQLPTIVNDGTYTFTVRVRNDDSSPATGMVLLQLHAFSGTANVVSANATGGPGFVAAEFAPAKWACDTITIFSHTIALGGGSSRIYQFALNLDQGAVPFEWVPTLEITD